MKNCQNRVPWRSPRMAIVGAAIVAAVACALRAQQLQPGTVLAGPASSWSSAQLSEPPEAPGKISTETRLVTVYATVRDKHGKLVPTLNQQDFAVSEDGHPQIVTYFARENNQPLTVGLLVDTSGSQAQVLDQERTASFAFLDHMLEQDKDTAFVLHFDRQVELLEDVTASRPKLQAALKLLAPSRPDREDDSSTDRGSGRPYRSGTHLYDAVYLAAHDIMSKQKGRKAVFVLTDGNDRGSRETLEEAIEAAQRADTAVYAIYFPGSAPDRDRDYGPRGAGPRIGVGWPGSGPVGGPGGGGGHRGGYPETSREEGKKVLDRMTRETGGGLFEISKKLSLDEAYTQVQQQLRNRYTLGYTPNPAHGNDGGFHRIAVTVASKDDLVEARDGYYSGP